VIYSDVMTSSMEVLSGAPLWHGLAAVPRVQLQGRGDINKLRVKEHDGNGNVQVVAKMSGSALKDVACFHCS
jgi:hypothetical protein